MTLLDGITAQVVPTARLAVNVLVREHDRTDAAPDQTVVFLHDTVASAAFFRDLLQDLPGDIRPIAVDLRGHGGTEHAAVDATRGLGDFSDDLAALLDALGIPSAHLVGWGLGAAVAQRFALDHRVLSLTLLAPLPPHGFGGTRRDGSLLADDAAGTGAGAASEDFVARLEGRDAGADAETSPRQVLRRSYVAPGFRIHDEDRLVEAMLSTSTADGNYPGDRASSPHWPGFAPGRVGVLNAVAPGRHDVSALVDVEPKPPILWIRGDGDAIVSDTSFYDTAHLGSLGIVPDWPGEDAAPAQPMVTQTRDLLERYRERGGTTAEVVLEGVGHTPHLERPAAVRSAILRVIGYVGSPADPAPPTEAIVLRSSD